MRIKPIKKLIVNGTPINEKTDWEKLGKAECYAFDLFLVSAYPTYLKTEVENRYGKQNFTIVPSNHKKYQKQRKENPEYFDYENYIYDIPNHIFTKIHK